MALSSFAFLLYFLPVVLAVYFLLGFSRQLKNLWLLISSIFFFAWDDPIYLSLLFFLLLANYVLGFQADKARHEGGASRWVFVLTCIVNLGPLIIYKYFGPWVSSIQGMTNWSIITVGSIAVPLGIGIMALQGISYVADTYHGKAPLEKNFVNCALYLCFFPTLAGGPLIRYHDVAGQIRQRQVSWNGFSQGFCRFVVGLAKSVLVAQPLSVVANLVFDSSSRSGMFTTVPALMALTGMIAFVLQMYYQFSGFTDMALGLGRMFGFDYPENFQYPVMALSVTEFWQRCYRSLTVWFSEYVREPFVYGQVNRDRLVRALFIMWMLIGLWMGPGIPTLIFGFWNFILILVEDIAELNENQQKKGLRHLYVIVTMSLGIICLRTPSIYEFALFISNLVGMNNNGLWDGLTLVLLREYWLVLAVGVLFLFPIAPWIRNRVAAANGFLRSVAAVIHPCMMAVLVLFVLIFLIRAGYTGDLQVEYNLWSSFYG